MRHILAAILALLFVGSELRAWSCKEHVQLTRIAALRLAGDPATPPAMKAWLLANAGASKLDWDAEKNYFLNKRMGIFPRDADGLPYWSNMPDLVAILDRQERKVEPFGVSERQLHFIDLEYFMPEESQRKYADDLSHKPKLDMFPRDMTDARYLRSGMLPFRVEQAYKEMVKLMKAGRLSDEPGRYPRDEHAAKWGGYLAHYLEDNTQPQHATEDYQSKSYFKEMRTPPNVHSDVEYKLLDDENNDYMAVRKELWEAFVKALGEVKDDVQIDDLWKSTLEVSLISYDALPMIGKAAAAAYTQPDGKIGPWRADVFFQYKGKYLGRDMTVMEMKAHQLAWAVARVERVWKKAWEEASKP